MTTSRFFLLVVGSIGSIGPNGTSAQPIKRGSILYQYGTVAGGWILNRRCRFLSPALSEEFTWHNARITEALSKRGVPSGRILAIQRSARQTASKPIYASCRQNSRKIVAQAFAMARRRSHKLTGLRYTAASVTNIRLARFAFVTTGVNRATNCSYWAPPGQPSIRPRVMRIYNAVMERLLGLYGTRLVNLALSRGHGSARRLPCGARARRAYLASLRSLRVLQRELNVR